MFIILIIIKITLHEINFVNISLVFKQFELII